MTSIIGSIPFGKGQFIIEPLLRGGRWGLAGGFVGTLVMDFLLISVLLITKQPPLACFAIAGDTVARLFTGQPMETSTNILLGILTHYSVGPSLGMIFGIALMRFKIMREAALMKGIFVAILYLQVLSQPLLALAAVILKMTTTQTLLWFGGAFVMHTIMGVVLGTVIYYGVHRSSKAYQEQQT